MYDYLIYIQMGYKVIGLERKEKVKAPFAKIIIIDS